MMAEERKQARARAAAAPGLGLGLPGREDETPPAEPAQRPTWVDGSTFEMAPRPAQLLTDAHRLRDAVPSVWHINDWVTEAEEAALIACADRAPPSAWTQLRGASAETLEPPAFRSGVRL